MLLELIFDALLVPVGLSLRLGVLDHLPVHVRLALVQRNVLEQLVIFGSSVVEFSCRVKVE